MTVISGSNGDRPERQRDAGSDRFIVRNEFGIVAVSVCGGPGRERLRIEDLRTQAVVELDALELESLAWSRHSDLADLLDPGKTRWKDDTVLDPPGHGH